MECLWTEEEELRQLHELQRNEVIDLQFRRQKYSFYDGVGRCGYCEPHSHKKSNPLGLLSFQGVRLCYVKMLMCALKIIFHIEKHLFVVLVLEQPSKERAEC